MFHQVYQGLRQAILAGTFRAGERLPSTRDLAEQLGVSRTVALLAYDQLLAEGYVEGRGGSGTYVAQGLEPGGHRPRERSAHIRLSRFGSLATKAASQIDFPGRPLPLLRYDFAYGRSNVDSFPFEMWRRILLRQSRKTSVRELDYGPAGGSAPLREAIAVHLRRSRGVICEPSQILIVNGSQQALDLIARILLERGDAAVVEDPQYQGVREILRTSGAQLLPVPVDGEGINPALLPKRARIACVTPSHQFPTGAILPLARRLALLTWAKRCDAVIIEDDYDGEFRYAGHPVESLQGLDTEGRVIYVGTFSRTVFSALRIGYLVVPKALVPAFTATKWLCDRHTATLEQRVLAEFITSGIYERYLRRIRRRNAERRRALLDSLDKYIGDWIEVTGDGAGAHVVLWPRGHESEEVLVDRAADHGVRVYGIARYYLRRPARAGLLLGYARLREAEIRGGIRRLAECL